MSIRGFLGLGAPRADTASVSETETVRAIVAALDALPPDQARYIAAFAYILSRVAHADLDISAAEKRAMERLVMQEAGVSEAQAVLIVEIAKGRSLLFGGTENYVVTREFNRLASHEQKVGLLRCLAAVSSADASISTVEDNEMRRIARELKVEPREYLEARAPYREHLEVLKKPTDGT